jgi:hypothetical protein
MGLQEERLGVSVRAKPIYTDALGDLLQDCQSKTFRLFGLWVEVR